MGVHEHVVCARYEAGDDPVSGGNHDLENVQYRISLY